MTFMDDSNQGPVTEGQPEGSEGQSQETQQPQQQVNYSPYAQNYLNQVPEAEREIVGRHLRNWDSGFTRYAQGVQSELKRYKDLGDPETLQTAHGIYQRLINDPQAIADYLYENGYAPTKAEARQQAAQVTDPNNQGHQGQSLNGQGNQSDPYADRFKQYDQQYSRLERAIGLMAEQFQTQQRQAEQAAAEKQLDEMITGIKSKDKTIPDQFILAYLNAGVLDPEQIAGEWRNAVQTELNRRGAGTPSNAPQLMGSGSQGPVAPNTANMTDEQRREALLSRLPF